MGLGNLTSVLILGSYHQSVLLAHQVVQARVIVLQRTLQFIPSLDGSPSSFFLHKSRQAFKLWSVQRTESNRQAFKAHKATYQREIRNAKLSSWNKLCDSQPSSSDLFSALKTKSGKSANVSLPSSISIDGSVSSNPTDILKKCAEHFFPSPTPSTQAHAQAEELAASFSQSSATFCVPSNSPPISQEELSNAIASLNLKSAPGADGLSTAIIYFSGIRRSPSGQNQHGFTQGRSTETAAHSLISFCDEGRDAKCVTACAFLDIKNAFDAAWHPAIISALAVRNCPRYLVQLVFDFLSNRTAIFFLEGSSSSFHVDLGCPQGGVLPPFLWSVLVDDVLRLKFSYPFRILGYADDLTVATYHKDPSIATRNLQTMCDEVSNWCLITLTINGIAFKTVPPSIESTLGHRGLSPQMEFPHRPVNKIAKSLRSKTVSLSLKKGVKQLRTFQRSIALSLASSFKTVSAEACFILTNILPIYLRLQEITHLRFSSGCTGFFSALSLKWLTGKLPSCSPLLKCDSYRRHSNHYWPPWAPPLYPTLLSEVCTLLPTKDSVLRIFIATSRCGASFNCCIISTCHKNVMKVTNGPLSANSLHHARQLSVLHALIQASRVVESGLQVEIFAQHISSFAFARYGAHLSEVERLCVDAAAPYRENLRLVVCQPPSAEGIQLALAGCDIPGSGLNVLPQLLISKTSYRHSITKLVRDAWQAEWQACYNGQLT
uniref:Reverse transcriptase domain-containing protein n=1 Tax=Daphnia galeata TaxID=27404 RepID=A0A8J2RTH0_9CRUS|nr:unnamed protein product [Daphnia galeata]